MKRIYTLAILAALTVVSVQAGESLGSPRAQEQSRRVANVEGKQVRQSFEYRGGKGAYVANSTTKGTTQRDLVREQRSVVYTGKNPVAPRSFENAPVK